MSSKFLRFLIPLNKEPLASFSIIGNKFRIKISTRYCLLFIPPSLHILIIYWQLHRKIMLFLIHFKLLRQGCSNCNLHLLNLFSIKDIIIQNLPFFDLSLIHIHLFLSNSFFPITSSIKYSKLTKSSLIIGSPSIPVAPLSLHTI